MSTIEPKYLVLDAYFNEYKLCETEDEAEKAAKAAVLDEAYDPPFYVSQIIGKAEPGGVVYTKVFGTSKPKATRKAASK